MDLTNVDVENLKTLEQYALTLLTGLISLKTLETFHITAIKEGLLTEDLICRANTIILDIRRDIKLYHDQLEGVLQLLPDDFDVQPSIDSLKVNNGVTSLKKPNKKGEK